MPGASVSKLKRGGLALLVTTSVVVGCSYRTNGTGVIDDGSGGNAAGIPTTTGALSGAVGGSSPTSTPTSSSSGSGGTTQPGCPVSVNPGDIRAYEPPIKALHSCSAMDFATISSKVNDTSATYTDLYNAVSPSCQTCLFSDETSTHWQPIVWSPNMSMGNAFVNYGACYFVQGGGTPCGKGGEDLEQCLELACPSMCTDQKGCVSSAEADTCAAYVSEENNGCGANVKTVTQQCSTFLSLVSYVCGSGTGTN